MSTIYSDFFFSSNDSVKNPSIRIEMLKGLASRSSLSSSQSDLTLWLLIPYVFISLFHTIIFVVVAVVGLRGENIWKSKVDRHSPVSSLLVVAKIGTGGTPERQERILFLRMFGNLFCYLLNYVANASQYTVCWTVKYSFFFSFSKR